jgi:hypothetical protein
LHAHTYSHAVLASQSIKSQRALALRPGGQRWLAALERENVLIEQLKLLYERANGSAKKVDKKIEAMQALLGRWCNCSCHV